MCASQISALEELSMLIDQIPLISDIPSNAKFSTGISIDSQIPIAVAAPATTRTANTNHNSNNNTKVLVSFRDIIKLLVRILRQTITANNLVDPNRNLGWESLISEQRFKQLRDFGPTYPINYLLFDFCLAWLDGDLIDARLYLAHSLHILSLHRSINLILSVIINESLVKDNDARELVTLLARISEPRNAIQYLETFGPGFRKRYSAYLEEVKRVSLR